MTERSDRGKPRGRRWGCWCCSILLVIALVPVVLYLVAWHTTAARYAAEVQRLQRAGETLKLSELVPKVGDDEDNAATVYEQAFGIQPKDLGSLASNPRWSPAEAALARQLVADSKEYFDTLEEASRIPKCVFEKDWNAGPNIDFTEFSQFREAARALQVRSKVQRLGGRYDEALASCATSLRIADHCDQAPVLIGYLTAVAVQIITLDELEKVLSSGDPSPAACRSLYQQLGKRTRLDSFVYTMRGERAWQMQAFDFVERQGTMSGMLPDSEGGASWLLDLYPILGKPLWNLDKINALHMSQRNINAAGKPYAAASQEMSATEKAVEQLPSYSSIMTRILSPTVARALWSAHRSIAYAGAAQIAVAAKAYKRTHGAYPASLEGLARDGWALPRDPFTGKAYRYARRGGGIAVWSVGPDMTDNLGKNYDVRTRQDQLGYDFVFSCTR